MRKGRPLRGPTGPVSRSGPAGEGAGWRPPGTEPPRFVPRETKLHAPRRQEQLIRRASLVDSLLHRAEPLVLLSAPGGWGKTLAVRQWMDADERPFAWLQLDGGDNDPVTLLQYVTRALGHVTPLAPIVKTWLELPQPPVDKVVVPTLAAAISSGPPFVLVLDDSHLVGEPRCWALLAELVEALPPGSTFAVCGRMDPPLHLSRLRAQDALAEYRYEALAFTGEETRQLLDVHGVDADEQVLDALLETTEGWAAGLYLAVLGCVASGRPLTAVPESADLQAVADYLAAEVLTEQDPEVVEFLTRTAVVPRLCGDLADALTGRDDGARMLDAIDEQNLFVMRLDGHPGWYRYHHLFAELLQTELRRREPQSVSELHRRAARWLEERDCVDDALRHWLLAGEVRSAGDLLAARWPSRYLTGRLLTVRRWVDAFTPDQVRSHAPLAMTAAWVMALTGDGAAALGLLATLDVVEPEAPSPDGAVSLRSSLALLRAVLAAEGPAQMLEDARSAVKLEEVGGAGGPWHGLACEVRGVAEMLTDDDEAAASDFRRAAPENRAFRNGLELADLGHLSLIAGDAGRWDEAEAHVAEAARIAGTYELGDCLPGVPARLARDRLCARGGDDDAAADLEELADQLDREFCPWLRIEAAMLCAEAALDRGDVSNAAHWLGEARAGPAGWAQAPGLRRRLEELEGRHVAQASVEPLTPAEVRVLTLLPTNLTVPEIAARLGVSRNTVGTHVKAIHRKLGASHRSHAVERAVELGLVPGRPPAG